LKKQSVRTRARHWRSDSERSQWGQCRER